MTFPASGRGFFSVVFLSTILLLFSFSSSRAVDEGGKPKRPVKIGVSLSLSGRYEEMGKMQERGYLLWQDDVNSRGGLLGREVRLIIEDDESSPARAKRIYRKLMDQERVDFIFGPYSTGITEAVAPLAESRGYFLLVSGASGDQLWEKGYRGVFGVYAPASRYATGFLEMLVKNGFRTVAILCADDSFSRLAGKGARRWTTWLGLSEVYFREFPKDLRDFSGIVEELKGINPDAVILGGHYRESVEFARALESAKWRPSAFFATVGPALPDFVAEAGDASEMVFSASQWEPVKKVPYPGSLSFAERFRRKFGSDPSYHAATAYAAGQILEESVRRAGTLEREAVAETIRHLFTLTIIGRFGVDSTGKQVKHIPFTIQIQGGKRVVVWPEEVAEGFPLFSPSRRVSASGRR